MPQSFDKYFPLPLWLGGGMRAISRIMLPFAALLLVAVKLLTN